MKKILMTLLALVASSPIFADSVKVSVSDATLAPGETAKLSINVTNDVTIGSITMSVELPECLSFTATNARRVLVGTDRMPDGATTSGSFSDEAKKIVRVNTYDADGIEGTGIEPGEGAIYTFEVKVADEIAPGQYEVKVYNVTSADLSGEYGYEEVTTCQNGIVTIPEPAPATFTVQALAEANGAVQVSPEAEGNVYEVGTEVTITAVPNEGYEFAGWSNGSTENPLKITVEADITVTATFVAKIYTVTFVADGQTVKSEELPYGSAIVTPEAPAKEGHTFAGWTPEVDATVPATDVTYTATYTVNTYKVSYYVGEQLVHEDEVKYGETIPEYIYTPDSPTATFNGWVGEKYDTMPAHDITYKADITDALTRITTSGAVNIYSLGGILVQSAANLQSAHLPAGIYLVNGKKMVVR